MRQLFRLKSLNNLAELRDGQWREQIPHSGNWSKWYEVVQVLEVPEREGRLHLWLRGRSDSKGFSLVTQVIRVPLPVTEL